MRGLAGLCGIGLLSGVSAAAAQAPAGDAPLTVARAYFEAMESGDLDAAEALFASESSVFEGGKAEGDWASYRAHHIGPEIDAFSSMAITTGEARVVSSSDGSVAIVAWPIEYRVEFKDGRTVDSQGVVTFALVMEGGHYRIGHLHWSSRRTTP